MPAASPDLSVNRPALDRQYCRAGGLGKTKANVVVTVVGVVPVPVRRAQVLRFVPGTAANHTLAVASPVPLVKITWERNCGSSSN